MKGLQEFHVAYTTCINSHQKETGCFIAAICELTGRLDAMQARNDQFQWTTRESLKECKDKFTQVHLALGDIREVLVETKEAMNTMTKAANEVLSYTKHLGGTVCEHHPRGPACNVAA